MPAGRGLLAQNGKSRRYEEALPAYDRALALDATDAATWAGKAWVLAKLRHYGDALDAYDIALELDPTDADTWAGKAWVLMRMWRLRSAWRAVERAYELGWQGYPKRHRDRRAARR